jgi:hypothetical protein
MAFTAAKPVVAGMVSMEVLLAVPDAALLLRGLVVADVE